MNTDDTFESARSASEDLWSEFVSLDTTDYDANLAEVCFKMVGWWMEDYSFEDLLEEFNVLPEEAFYHLVKAGLIDEDQIEKYLATVDA